MKKFLHINLPITGFLVIFAGTFLPQAFADGSIMPFGEIGRIGISEEPSFRLESKNDSLGCLSRTDWDDLRTFGFYGGFSAHKWAAEITGDSLTNRADTIDDRGRIDELHASVFREVLGFSAEQYSMSLAAGAGAMFLGNNGMYAIQKAFHATYQNKRPIPATYDDPENRLTFLAEGIMRLHRDSPVIPLDFFSSLEAGHTGFLRTGTFVDATILDGFLGANVFGGVNWATNYAVQGKAFAATLDSENGIQVGTEFHAGLFEVGYSYNIDTTRQGAYLAVSIGGHKDKKTEHADSGQVQSIEFGMEPFLGVIRIRKSIARDPLIISAMLGADSGNMNPTGITVEETEIYQYEQLYAGIDLARKITPWMDAYVMGGGGIREEQHRTRTVAASRVLESQAGFVVLSEGGIRLYLPGKDTQKGEWGVVLSGGVEYAQALVAGLHPYFHVSLLGMTGREN